MDRGMTLKKDLAYLIGLDATMCLRIIHRPFFFVFSFTLCFFGLWKKLTCKTADVLS